MLSFLKNEFGVKGFFVVVICILISAIVGALIVNPLSLNPEKNSIINFILGSLMSTFTTIVNSYFKDSETEFNNKHNNKKSNGVHNK